MDSIISYLNKVGKQVIAIDDKKVLCYWEQDNSFVVWSYYKQETYVATENGEYYKDKSSALKRFYEQGLSRTNSECMRLFNRAIRYLESIEMTIEQKCYFDTIQMCITHRLCLNDEEMLSFKRLVSGISEDEAIEYFKSKMSDYDYAILGNKFSIDDDGPMHNIEFVIGDQHHIHTFSVWMETNGIYGEW